MLYPAYDDYKNTRIEFIGDIPKHWEVRKLKFMASIENGRDYKHVESSEGFDVIGSGGAFVKASDYLYDGESVLFGRKGTVDVPLYINGKFWTVDTMFYSVIHEDTVAKYLYYCATVMPFKFLATQTALPSMTQFDLENFVLTYPNKKEQQEIADFLDYKTQQIDQLIEKKKALIEKLNEQRIAVITQIITKGIDKNVKMKPSGVDWLGDVPEHWEIRRLKFLSNERLQYGANESAEMDDRDQPRFIRITDVKPDGTLYDNTFRSLPEEVAEPFLLSTGDILLARSGATVGKTFIYSDLWGTAAYAGYLIRFRVDEAIIDADFAYAFFQTSVFWANINSTLIQSTIQNFSAEKYANIILPLPPIEEQLEINSCLNIALEKVDEMALKARNIIEKLEEYRGALITSAVTGKIDVRDVGIGEI